MKQTNMYNRLVEYADKRLEIPVPGFTERKISYVIDLDHEGNFLNIFDKRNDEGKFLKPLFMKNCPMETDNNLMFLFFGSKNRSDGFANFLIDSLETVILLNPEEPDKQALKNGFFTMLLHDCATWLIDRGLDHSDIIPVIGFLSSDEQMGLARDACSSLMKMKNFETVTFSIEGKLVVKSENWKSWWNQFWLTEEGSDRVSEKEMVCFLTGKRTHPVKTHRKIKGLQAVGGNSSGDSLIAAGKQAFESFGLVQGENSAVSPEAELKYTSALNELLKNSKSTGQGIKYVYWFNENVEFDVCNYLENEPELLFEIIEDEDDNLKERSAIELIDEQLVSLKSGKFKNVDISDIRYYFMMLSGMSGRVMLRYYTEGDLCFLTEAVLRWFKDQMLETHFQKEGSWFSGYSKPQSFFRIMCSLVRDVKSFPSPLKQDLWKAAIENLEIPTPAVVMALDRMRMEILSEKENILVKSNGIIRLGIMKMFLIRNHGIDIKENMTMVEHTSYHVGRLLSILEDVQYKAIGDTNKGVVEKFYSSASRTPSIVLGKMLSLTQHHLSKIGGGMKNFFNDKIAEIVSNINFDDINRTFDLKDQSLFSLGYYHQKSETAKERRWRKNEKMAIEGAMRDPAAPFENAEDVIENDEDVSDDEEDTETFSMNINDLKKNISERIDLAIDGFKNMNAGVKEYYENLKEDFKNIKKTPEVVSETPEVVSETPEVVSETPEVVSETPEVVSETPEVVSESPEVVSESPKVVSESPEVVSETPEVVSETPGSRKIDMEEAREKMQRIFQGVSENKRPSVIVEVPCDENTQRGEEWLYSLGNQENETEPTDPAFAETCNAFDKVKAAQERYNDGAELLRRLEEED